MMGRGLGPRGPQCGQFSAFLGRSPTQISSGYAFQEPHSVCFLILGLTMIVFIKRKKIKNISFPAGNGILWGWFSDGPSQSYERKYSERRVDSIYMP